MSQSEPRPEVFISIDVETAGSVPSRFALLSIGACLVDDPEQAFYVEDAFGLSREFAGLANFQAVLSDATYYQALGTTLVFSLAGTAPTHGKPRS